MFTEKISVSKIKGNTKIQMFENIFKIPTNSFSQFWRYHILTRICVGPYNIWIWYIRIKKNLLPYVLNFKVKILMTHCKDIMIECFICLCTRDTHFLKINFIVINTLTLQCSMISINTIRSCKLLYIQFFSTYVVLFVLKRFHQ